MYRHACKPRDVTAHTLLELVNNENLTSCGTESSSKAMVLVHRGLDICHSRGEIPVRTLEQYVVLVAKYSYNNQINIGNRDFIGHGFFFNDILLAFI